MPVRKIAAIILLAAVLIPSFACLNPVSIEDCGYVVAVGADIGKEKKYIITLELQRESFGTDSENNGGAIILSCEADSLSDAVNGFSANIAYDLNFTRTHMLIFGEELARVDQIEDFLKFSFDVFRIRSSALLLIAESSAFDYIGGLASDDAANIAKLQDHMIANSEKTGTVAAINAARFFEACDGGTFDAVLPFGRIDGELITDKKQKDSADKGENPLKDAEPGSRIGGMQALSEGAALFDGSRMVGKLSAYDTQILNLGKGDFRQGTLSIITPNGNSAGVYLNLQSRTVSLDLAGETPEASIKLKLNVTVEYDPEAEIGMNWENGGCEWLKDHLESELRRLFCFCRDLNCDAMGFGKDASMKFSSVEEWEKLNWKERYHKLEAHFSVELILDDEYILTNRD